ncbi:MAG: glutamate formimidoyltransferase [Flavobacteriaceae bacterium]|nr:glutamate formimidoyltransferase [Flavobacteriaceae bacterium]
MRLIECVPNFSEGRDLAKIKQITDAIESAEGVKLLDVDPGNATNRTVVTIVGSPEAVIEGAFRGIKKAAEVIDMSQHTGAHPRMGATDVCPLIPVSGVTDEEAIEYAKQLAKRVGEELSIPVYLYEKAQANPDRKNLAVIRAGEYEGFAKKIKQPKWKPDFGPVEFPAKAGATVIGVRTFLIAYNVNLNTKSTRLANSVAFDIRENGRAKREGNPYTGKVLKDADDKEVRILGALKECKAIGWFIEEYNVAQVSINLTDPTVTSVHHAFDECCKSANKRGMRVTGSELVGLIPLKALLDAGRHYLSNQKRSLGVSEQELIHIAVKSMGLDELSPFDPQKKIIEYQLRNLADEKLVAMSLLDFADETASESTAPGGGSIAAYCGTLGISLGTMVANLSAGKRGWEDKTETFSKWAEEGQLLKAQLMRAVDEDTAAFTSIMYAFGLPKGSEEEKAARIAAIEEATMYAVEVPLRVMQLSADCLPLIEAMITDGNPNSITDAGVGALCIRTAVHGACMNVRVNASGLKDRAWADNKIAAAKAILQLTETKVAEMIAVVESKI